MHRKGVVWEKYPKCKRRTMQKKCKTVQHKKQTQQTEATWQALKVFAAILVKLEVWCAGILQSLQSSMNGFICRAAKSTKCVP